MVTEQGGFVEKVRGNASPTPQIKNLWNRGRR